MRHIPPWVVRTVAYCVTFLVLAVTAWVVTYALARVLTITFAVVAALLLAAMLAPLRDLLGRVRLPRWAAALVSELALLLVVGSTLALVVSRALSQVEDLEEAVTTGVQNLKQLIVDSPLPFSQTRLDRAQEELTSFVTDAVPSPTAGASAAVDLLSGTALALFLLFFLLKDGERMWQWAVGWVPVHRAEYVDGAGQRAWDTLTRYVRGIVVVALIDAVGVAIAMLALGVPLAASLTLIVFIGAFVPIVGTTVSGAVAVGVTLVTVSPLAALILLGAVLLVQAIEGNLLQPLVMGRTLQLHPVVIVMSVAVGTILGGVLGAIVAVPLVAVGYRLAEYLADRETSPAPRPAD